MLQYNIQGVHWDRDSTLHMVDIIKDHPLGDENEM
jgi:hypothetical protein